VHFESAVKQVASVLHQVLGLRKKEESRIPLGTVLTSSDILKAITSQIYFEVTEAYEETELSTEELTNVARCRCYTQLSSCLSLTFTQCMQFS
jgi:hypothetical protein